MLVSHVLRTITAPRLARSASIQVRGLPAILQKHPEDVVITFAKRTAMGRAKKGQLKDVPVDKILYSLFQVRMHR
jgi:acetyl-CoA acyltransferase 1